MDGLSGIGRMLIYAGLALAALGAVLVFAGKVPYLGKLPGDIHIKGDKWSFYFPLTTGIVISVLLTVIVNLFKK